MTFNIFGPWPEEGVNIWPNRAGLNVKTIRRYKPDLIGFQEVGRENLVTYQEPLAEYSSAGIGPDGDEWPPIFWKSARFELLESGIQEVVLKERTMSIPVLETDRLIIRPFVIDDLETCHQLFDLDSTIEAPSFEDRRVWLQWAILNYEALDRLFQPPYGDRAIVLRSTREMIGSVGLVPSIGPFGRLPSFGLDPCLAHYNMSEFGLFWALLRAHWGHGYATEAAKALITYTFTTLNLRRIVATTDYDNVRSQAVMRRLGMRIEKNPYPEPHWFQVVGVLENVSS